MPDDPTRDPLFRDPLIDGPYRPVQREAGSGWVAAILGILAVLALVFYFSAYTPSPERTASNATVTTTKTEKVIPPATPVKPATQPTQTQPATQPQ
jgi:hypothetical protein